VYATARRRESIADLEAAGARTLALDVTDEQSMVAAVDAVTAAEGAVGVLVNNAGYSQSGAIETVPMDAVRRQFETNVFGAVRLTQLVLEKMRAQRWGRIVNVGSMGGRLTFPGVRRPPMEPTFPGAGHYHATKHALEAISDALRFELRGFGIAVILLEPGLITTEFGVAATASMTDLGVHPQERADGDAASTGGGGEDAPADPYAHFNATVGAVTAGAYEGPMRMLGAGPERVAKVIERAIAREHPPARIRITPSARIMIATRRLLGDRAWDAAMRRQFPQPG
jgi:NAD(P)-dependent dehydrogenase (short-subunit alcohol dehydrogenase family)